MSIYTVRIAGSQVAFTSTSKVGARLGALAGARAWDPRVARLFWVESGDGWYGYATRADLYADRTGDRPDLIRASFSIEVRP